ncbi:RNA polymerase sigma factor [Aliikangiella sp. IMCC44632]
MQQAQQDLLVLEAQSGNQKAFECLVIYFHPQLVHFASKLSGNHALAKDAVQDVWISSSKNLRKLNDPRAFKSWIFRSLRWRVLDLLKAKSYQFETLDNLDLSEEINEAPVLKEKLSKLIEALPLKEREVVYLFYSTELTLVEITQVLTIPLGTVKSRLNRARKTLQQQLQ